MQSHKEKTELFINDEKDLQAVVQDEEILAVDGGWGWMVTLGMTVVIVSNRLHVFKTDCARTSNFQHKN